jgi:UPF0755 protein
MKGSEKEKSGRRRGAAEKVRVLWLRIKGRRTPLFAVGAGLALAAALAALFYVHFFSPPSAERLPRIVTIRTGTAFWQVARILEDQGVVRDRRSFYLLARFRDAVAKIKAGEYEFHAGMAPAEVLDKLVRGEVIHYPVTIPEGFDVFLVAEVLEKAGVAGQKAFLEKAHDPAFIASLGFEGDSLEGYLFPDTYRFPKGYGEEAAMRRMVSRFQAVFAPLEKKAEEMGLSRKDAVTLASMIEKEAADDRERPLISAVFHNRLRRGMALQSDPTAIYGVQRDPARGETRITRRDLMKKTPYNTYQIAGLPKGPIANPGLKSLEAVVNPAEVDYLYFVSRNDRTHFFSSTLEEHNRAVDRYQRRTKKPPEPAPAKVEPFSRPSS